MRSEQSLLVYQVGKKGNTWSSAWFRYVSACCFQKHTTNKILWRLKNQMGPFCVHVYVNVRFHFAATHRPFRQKENAVAFRSSNGCHGESEADCPTPYAELNSHECHTESEADCPTLYALLNIACLKLNASTTHTPPGFHARRKITVVFSPFQWIPRRERGRLPRPCYGFNKN